MADVGGDDLMTIMYTSGTTGLPKGIQHTHFIRARYATLMANAWRMTPESVVLHCGSLVFNGAMVTMLPAFMLGATYVLHAAFDATAFIASVERERVRTSQARKVSATPQACAQQPPGVKGASASNTSLTWPTQASSR